MKFNLERIRDKEEIRYKVLEIIYYLSEESDYRQVTTEVLLSKLPEINNEELNKILQYLESKYFIKGSLSGNAGYIFVTITSEGIDIIENKLSRISIYDSTTREITMNSGLKLFISHSSNDADVAEAIIDLLRAALNLSAEEIRCTSVDGYGLPIGSDTDDQLRKEIFDTKVFMGLISYDSLNSAYVMFELGARWGSNKYLAPLLCPGIETSILQSPLTSLNALSCSNNAHLQQLVVDVGNKLEMKASSPAAYQKFIDKILVLPFRSDVNGTRQIFNNNITITEQESNQEFDSENINMFPESPNKTKDEITSPFEPLLEGYFLWKTFWDGRKRTYLKADIDGDGNLEDIYLDILTPEITIKLVVIIGDGGYSLSHEIQGLNNEFFLSPGFYCQLAVVDVNCDGLPEILLAIKNPSDIYLNIWEFNKEKYLNSPRGHKIYPFNHLGVFYAQRYIRVLSSGTIQIPIGSQGLLNIYKWDRKKGFIQVQ